MGNNSGIVIIIISVFIYSSEHDIMCIREACKGISIIFMLILTNRIRNCFYK